MTGAHESGPEPVAGALPAAEPAVAHVFVDGLADEVRVSGPDGHHLQRVRRIGPGEHLTAADGTGAWRRYTVSATAKGELVLVATGPCGQEPVRRPGLVSAVAALARARIEWLIPPLSELGVDRLVLVRTERVQHQITSAQLDRFVVLARESAMQARRTRPMIVEGTRSLHELGGLGTPVVADRDGVAATDLPGPDPSDGAGTWVVVSGPEGGFGPRDREALAGAPRLALGPHVLRAETAAVAAAATLTQRRS